MLSAGIARATSKPPASTIESTGRRMTRSVSADQKRESPAGRRLRPMNGSRPFSTRSPSQSSIAGSMVSEANIAIATTIIVP
jgi:hypothetical protein